MRFVIFAYIFFAALQSTASFAEAPQAQHPANASIQAPAPAVQAAQQPAPGTSVPVSTSAPQGQTTQPIAPNGVIPVPQVQQQTQAPPPPALPPNAVLALDPKVQKEKQDRIQRLQSKGMVMPGLTEKFAQSVFAVPGKTCPSGSIIDKGPESKNAAKDGFVYCVFVRNIFVFPKEDFPDGCPLNTVTYKDKDATIVPDSDVIWCKKDFRGMIKMLDEKQKQQPKEGLQHKDSVPQAKGAPNAK